MELIINTEADASNSLVTAIENNTATSLLPLYLGDKRSIQVTLTNGQGGLWEYTGQAGLGILLGIGTLEDRNPMATASLAYSNGSYTGTIDLDNSDIENFIGTNTSEEFTLEVQVSFYDGTTETLLQKEIIILKDLIQ